MEIPIQGTIQYTVCLHGDGTERQRQACPNRCQDSDVVLLLDALGGNFLVWAGMLSGLWR